MLAVDPESSPAELDPPEPPELRPDAEPDVPAVGPAVPEEPAIQTVSARTAWRQLN